MIIELKDDGYEKIMGEIQNIEDAAQSGIFPKRTHEQDSYKAFQTILSGVRKLRGIVQENLLIVSKTAGPEGPNAA